jgi:hypothetical protein
MIEKKFISVGAMSIEEIQKLILEWESSGLSQVAFCRERGISSYLFRKHRRLKKQCEVKETEKSFIKLPLMGGSYHPSYEIELKGVKGLSMKLTGHIPVEVLMRLMQELS